MLVYHPAFDIYHCIFRMLCLLEKLPENTYEVNRIRILDFYLLFPSQFAKVRLPIELISYRTKLNNLSNTYEKIEDPLRIFFQLESYQLAALNCLASYELIDINLLANGKVQRTAISIPDKLVDTIKKSNETEPNKMVIELLTGPFSNFALYGESGLKARTNLFEHRYDTV